MQFHSEISGRFRLDAVKLDANGDEIPGSHRVLADWFDNLITNGGLDRLGTAGTGSAWQYCRVGSGSTTPANTDTALAAQIASSNSIFSTSNGLDSVNAYIWRREVYQFNEGVATGNLAEVATSWLTTGTGIFSRALIKDSFGNPTTITVLADETLRVTWEVRQYYPTTDRTGSVVFTGNIGGTYDWTSRVADLTGGGNNWVLNSGGGGLAPIAGTIFNGGDLGAITGRPTFTAQSTMPTVTLDAYVVGSYQRTGTIVIPLATANNAAGITSILFSSTRLGNTFQLKFTPSIPKTASDVVSLKIGISWVRRP
jgi:hypothetical protein